MTKYILLLIFAGLFIFQMPAQAQEIDPDFTTDIANTPRKKDGKHLVNVDKKGVILRGYDVISFHKKMPVKGKVEFSSEYEGAIYLFASEENKNLFESGKAKYAPQFGGFCAVASALNKLSPIQLQTYTIENGRLLFQHNANALKLWNKDVKGNLKKADQNWPNVMQKTTYSNGYQAKDE